MQRKEIQTFINSPDFHELLEVVRKYDQEAPVGNAKWIDMDIAECPILADTENVWRSLSYAYRDGLGVILIGLIWSLGAGDFFGDSVDQV